MVISSTIYELSNATLEKLQEYWMNKTADDVRNLLIEKQVLDASEVTNFKLKGKYIFQAIATYDDDVKSREPLHSARDKMNQYLLNYTEHGSIISNWLIDYFFKKFHNLFAFCEVGLQLDLNSIKIEEEEIIMKSSMLLLSSFGANFPFVGRTQSLEQINSCFTDMEQCKLQNMNIFDSKQIFIPFIAAAPGTGKSKLLKHVGEHYFHQYQYFPIFISFGNGSSYDTVRESNMETSLSMRIIYSFMCGLIGYTKQFYAFQDTWNSWFGQKIVSMNETLQFIHSFVFKQNFVLLIDEAHQIDIKSYDKTENLLQSLVSIIGNQMQNPKFLVLPLLAGTNYTVIRNSIIESSFAAKYISIEPVLNEQDQSEILIALEMRKNYDGSILHPKLANWRIQKEFLHVLKLIGGLPRGFEFFLYFWLQNADTTVTNSYALTEDFLRNNYNYNFSTKLSMILLRYAVTRKQVTREYVIENYTNITWSNLENEGSVLLEQVDCKTNFVIPYYPPVLLNLLLQNIPNDMLLSIFAQTFNSTYTIFQQNCENIICNFLYIVFSFLVRQENLTLKDVFPFALMNQNTSKIHLLKLPSDVKLSNCSGNVAGLTPIDFTDTIRVVKNIAGDVLVFGLSSRDSKEQIVLQSKWCHAEYNSIPFCDIKAEVKKNQTKVLQHGTDIVQVRNITVILTGSHIYNPPLNNSTEFADDLIIVCKDNFSKYFGPFSELMRCVMHK